MSDGPDSVLAERRWRSPKRPRFVAQLEAADCAAACLRMVLGAYGADVSLQSLRMELQVSTSGASARSIVDVASRHGMHARVMRCELEELVHLQTATILHWDFNHFVVLEEVRGGDVTILDPAVGRRRMPLAQLGKSFTGIAIEFRADRRPLASQESLESKGPSIWQILLRGPDLRKILFLSLGLQLLALALPLFTGLVVDRVLPRGDLHLLGVAIAGLVGVVGFRALASLIRSHMLIRLRTHLDTEMTLGFLSHLVRLPSDFFRRRTTGDLMHRVSSNQAIRDMLASDVISAVLDGVLVVLYLGLVLCIDAGFAALLSALAMAQACALLLARRRLHELELSGLEAATRTQSNLVQLLAGIDTIKLAGAEDRAVERYSQDFSENLNVTIRIGKAQALLGAFLESFAALAPMLLLGYGAKAVIDGSMTLGVMLALQALGGAFLGPIGNLMRSLTSLQRMKSHLLRLEDVWTAEVEQDVGSGRRAQLRGEITIRDLSFRYRKDGPKTLDAIDLHIPAGACVALVGASGSGKSTLAHLLLALHDIDTGELVFDGHPLGDLDLRSLRSQVSLVPQDPYLFDSSIRDNIALAEPDASLDRIIEAARIACIHEDIMGMPLGYDTRLSERGASLSGGQRQRLALARALLSRPAVLILDEATSALDTCTEAAITANIARLRMTRIIVAHRLSTVRDADSIIVLDRGRVAEIGRHSQLVHRGGVYAGLVRAQMQPTAMSCATAFAVA